jgi:hypothetical protein
MARKRGTKPIKLVRQEDPFGCAVACIAMVLGRTYESVKADWSNDFAKDGVTTNQITGYLGDAGCSVLYKNLMNWNEKDFARKEMFRPFAPAHILCIKQLYDATIYHAVVMDAKGKIYDPAGHTDKEVKSWYLLDEVIGVYK